MKGSRIGVMPMMQFRESQKTGLEYDEIELAVFDLCFYIILCSVSLNILDKCDDPTLSKPLVYLHSKFPVTTWTSNFWRSILCSRRPSQNVFKKAFPGNEARPPTYQISKKKAKIVNDCLTACWASFSTETQQHRSTCHFFRLHPQDWNMTYLHVFAKRPSNHNSQWAFKLSFACWSSAKAGKSFPAVSRPYNMLNRGWRWAVTRDWKPLFCDHVEQPHQSRWLHTWSLV